MQKKIESIDLSVSVFDRGGRNRAVLIFSLSLYIYIYIYIYIYCLTIIAFIYNDTAIKF